MNLLLKVLSVLSLNAKVYLDGAQKKSTRNFNNLVDDLAWGDEYLS